MIKFIFLLAAVALAQWPHLGGEESRAAAMVIVDFETVTPGKVFKEMVQDLQ